MMRTVDVLYHFTCSDHGKPGIDLTGTLLPSRHPLLGVALLWLTDLEEPDREGLGLTSLRLSCDRTQHRYAVDPHWVDACAWWPDWARQHRVSRVVRDDLERFGRPAHWWVSEGPLPVLRTVAA